MNRSIFVAAVFGLTMMGGNAHAAFVYSNFGPGGSFSSVNKFDVNEGEVLGMSFTATSGGALTQVTMALATFSGNGAVTVELHAYNAGKVGSSLASGTATLSGSSPTLYTVAMSSASIVSGNNYWLVMKAETGATSNGWYLSNPASFGNVATSSDGGTTYSYSGPRTLSAFSVDAAPVSPVPEPSSFLMFALGGLAFGARSLRRVKQAIV